MPCALATFVSIQLYGVHNRIIADGAGYWCLRKYTFGKFVALVDDIYMKHEGHVFICTLCWDMAHGVCGASLIVSSAS